MPEAQKAREGNPEKEQFLYRIVIAESNFIEQIKTIPYLKNTAKEPGKDWKVFYGKTWLDARREAHISFYNDAKNDPILNINSALNDAKSELADAIKKTNAKPVGLSLVPNFVLSKFKEIGQHVPDDMPTEAALDANLAFLLFRAKLQGSYVGEKNESTIQKRMDVWKSGYALFGEISGTLYVYCPDSYKQNSRGMLR